MSTILLTRCPRCAYPNEIAPRATWHECETCALDIDLRTVTIFEDEFDEAP